MYALCITVMTTDKLTYGFSSARPHLPGTPQEREYHFDIDNDDE